MRYVSFAHHGIVRPGILTGAQVHPLPESFRTLIDFIAADDQTRSSVRPLAPIALGDVRLVAPVRPAKNIFCVGRNYLGHAEEVAKARGTPLDLPSVPTFFTKAPTAIADPEATLTLSPKISSKYDWEVELAVIIGKRCKDVPAEHALDVVFGYTCLNDVTARDLQRDYQQWFKGKSLDDTCPMGPWIVSANEIGDPQTLDVALRLNGVTKQQASTSTMIFDVKSIIAHLSLGMTLEPGDVISTGTPDGVGFARTPPEYLADGDVVELEISKIGVLRNKIKLSA
ncbi:MAG TPA: fumarylacetoacetate hydrolase family protein [Candidatus Baltobacteraceae bacterium]|jgi:2-keto-4-pentenoate hydratase/2-oxohepta-3-ene-1,7-dioic acid hydratase in catechol pathway|nr:fumarylacetoacetate hydrolase family protein [Candidatus Baltobacteraceae bacterium]